MTQRCRRSRAKGAARAASASRRSAIDDGDDPMCQRSLYYAWHMTTVCRSPPDDRIIIVAVARYTDSSNRAIPGMKIA